MMAHGPNFRLFEEPMRDWVRQANCLGYTAIFFPQPGESTHAKLFREAEAKAICSHCVVLFDCREYAHSHTEAGVWGGETEDERYSLGCDVLS